MIISALFVRSWIPGSAHRRMFLRAFGASLGRGVVLKPGLRVKFPWRLRVGDHTWLGEDVWIDNLSMVDIGSNCCISQGAYFCTGSHNWRLPGFNLVVKDISIEDDVWICARASVAPGVRVGQGSIVSFGAVVTRDVPTNVVLFAHGRLLDGSEDHGLIKRK